MDPVPPEAPSSPVAWSADGVPSAPRFGDIYHSESGALAQARHVFLAGNGLPHRWQRCEAFCIVETGFGLGLNFLATWQAWRADPLRPRRLHFVSLEAFPVSAADIARAAQDELAELGAELAARYPLPLPGLHRIEFGHEDACLILTLAIGDAQVLLPTLRLGADAFYLDGFSPALNPELWSGPIFKGLARLARPEATAATWSVAADVRKGLTEAGFLCEKTPGLPPKRHALRARYAPAWARPASWPVHGEAPASRDRHAVVVGAGIAGAATAHALLARGWRVTLLEAGAMPAAGASGLPAALMAPHVSPDDAPISRLTRAGAALMQEWMRRLPLGEAHRSPPGVLQFVPDRHKARAPAAWGDRSIFELRDTARGAARFFREACAVEPRALVEAMLAPQAHLEVLCHARVAKIVASPQSAAAQADARQRWTALDAQGRVLAEAPHVILAAARESLEPLLDLPGLARPLATGGAALLRPVRGQITLGDRALRKDALLAHAASTSESSPHALSGDGHLIAAWHPQQDWRWLVGASFERGETELLPTQAAHDDNIAKLQGLLNAPAPDRSDPLVSPATTFREWVQVRCASPDRLPLAGALPGLPGLYIVAALGSRGLSLAALLAELLASQLQEEPWPIEAPLAAALDPARFA